MGHGPRFSGFPRSSSKLLLGLKLGFERRHSGDAEYEDSGSGCLHRRLGILVYSVGYELGFPDLGVGNIVIMLAGIPENVSVTVIFEKEMVPENETVGKTMEVGITHCYDPLGPENSGSHVDVQATSKTKTAGGIGLTELVPSPKPSTLKKVQLNWFSVSDLSATRGCFFLQVGSSSHYRKMVPISIESGVIKSELMIVVDSFLFSIFNGGPTPADAVMEERHFNPVGNYTGVVSFFHFWNAMGFAHAVLVN